MLIATVRYFLIPQAGYVIDAEIIMCKLFMNENVENVGKLVNEVAFRKLPK